MGEKDITEKQLEEYNDVFADILNTILFNGRPVVGEDELEDVMTKSQYKSDRGILHEQERDIAKYWKRRKIRLAVFGLENQSKTDPYMPVRIMGYDGQSYRSQMVKKENGGNISIEPVVTLVLYFGTSRWKSRSLYDCMDVPEVLKPYVSNYSINVCEIAYLTEKQIATFTSDFRIVADYCRQMRVNKEYIPSDDVIRHVDSVLKLMSVISGDNRFQEFRQTNTGGDIKMHDVIDKAIDKGRQEGRQEGRREGMIAQYIETSKEFGAGDTDIIMGLIKKFNMSEQEAKRKLLQQLM